MDGSVARRQRHGSFFPETGNERRLGNTLEFQKVRCASPVINQIVKAAHKDRRKFFPLGALARYEIREGLFRSAELGV
jgi:hypothetical protein